MLIIFDLDDTIIDTSGFVLPFKLRECLKRLIEDGLPVKDVEQAYADLCALDSCSPRSKDSILQFVQQSGKDAAFASKALFELTTPLPKDFIVQTTPMAKEILSFLHKKHTLALVTGGSPPFQREKMEKASLDTRLFSRIAIPEDSVKKPFYEDLAKNFSNSPEQVWVCGDRVAIDLVPAKELGFRTIHMRWGRGKREIFPDWVDYSISSLCELQRIIL